MSKSVQSSGPIPERIIEFIQEHHLMALTVCSNEQPWCFHAFYAYSPVDALFVILSEEKTKHVKMIRENPQCIVSGGIALETKSVGLIRGLQFTGKMNPCTGSVFDPFSMLYLKKFPYAVFKSGDLWTVSLDHLKFTDNRLGFGTKLIWNRD